MYVNFLKNAGLSEGEATIYNELVQKGELSAQELTKMLKYKRGMVYKFLADLEKKGYIRTKKKSKKTYFEPEHPSKILDSIKDKLEETVAQQKALEAVLSDMETKYILQTTRPGITYYEDLEGIKKVFDDIYAEKNEPVYGAVNLEIADKAIPDYIQKKLIPIRIKNKVYANTFLSNSDLAKEVQNKDEKSLRTSKLLNNKTYPILAEIDVYEDKIALLSFEKGKFIGLLIENKHIATTLKSIFKLAFDKTK